jgi:hypothetical protein
MVRPCMDERYTSKVVNRWEIEEGLDLTMPIWMGKEPAERRGGTRRILQEAMQGRNPTGNK